MKRKTYQELLDTLKDLDLWLCNLGLPKQANRIRVHTSNVRKLEEARENSTLDLLTKKHGNVQLMWSLVEAYEFKDIYTVLHNYALSSLGDKLKVALKGPADPTKETPSSSSNLGRNAMFELNLASRLLVGKVPVFLETNPDILCKIAQRNIYIQCKRPFYEKNIPRNISAASRQLTRDLNNSGDKNARGIIAISVSHALNPGDKLFTAKTEHGMKRLADDIQALADTYSKSWKYIVDTRIIGILFHLITPAFIEDISLLTAAEQINIHSIALQSTYDRLLLRDLESLLRKPDTVD